jgi:hypothetical protein
MRHQQASWALAVAPQQQLGSIHCESEKFASYFSASSSGSDISFAYCWSATFLVGSMSLAL